MNTIDEITQLQAAAKRARDGYHHEEAVDYYTQALEIAPEGDDPAVQILRYDLHLSRGESYEWIGDNVAAMADFEAAVRLAEALAPEEDHLARQAEALNRLAELTLDQVGVSQAEELARKALDLACEVSNPRLEADSLDKLAQVLGSQGAFAEAGEVGQQVLALYRQAGDKIGEARTLYRMAFRLGRTSFSQDSIDLAQQAVSLARQAGDRLVEAQALNVVGVLNLDQAKKRAVYERALSMVQAVGRRGSQSSIINNLSLSCANLGLYRRGLAYAESYNRLFPDSPRHQANYVDIYGRNALGLGMDDARHLARQGQHVIHVHDSVDGWVTIAGKDANTCLFGAHIPLDTVMLLGDVETIGEVDVAGADPVA